MFGMSSTDFWENDPQLYWAYRTFYLKKKEYDNESSQYNAWLNGNTQRIGTQIAIAKTFGKDVQVEYPEYSELFEKNEKKEEKKVLTPEEKNRLVQEEFNAWARI